MTSDQQVRIANYRTEHHAELDLIVEHANGELWVIECQARRNVGKNELGGFKSFAGYYGKRPRDASTDDELGGATPRHPERSEGLQRFW